MTETYRFLDHFSMAFFGQRDILKDAGRYRDGGYGGS